ncbi:LysR family transcriptional regulator [Nocardia terpenica]|uniref:LysR family transcriptional regulator n=1 Tax=Nocardia terpenica TaxID=455432 RepID=A0A164KTB6_9NOCA|nr:LysR family transcriptional regulator [Nocardia terpenica]KZM71701.1 LysR family transcriptional regulator [Nocardia terpenica]MBF6063339.1 LysR family transcriptional regulator [Nocardia terpenica]MBF6105895.1 LysR family transcriptional regulator [Nocardia terpenica]MBF6113521.1 LysR family transcriptional regulator [Nocardia terpenica]MBF6119636.1 LysR family transcriptional regulator [Nocardia terpenica]
MPLSPRVPDLSALDLLLSVIELGSLGRAAQAHGISQPSASSRIRYLEKLVGVPVLERTTLGSRPTAAGRLIAEWAREVVSAAARLDAGIDTLRAQRDSRLVVAASQTVAEYLFPKWLMSLRGRAPGTSIALESGNSAEVARTVLDGQAGIGFIESPLLPTGLEGHEVARDELVVVVAPGHPWARRRRITMTDLATTPLIHREPSSGTRISFEQAMRRHYPDWQPATVLELSSTTAIKTAVAQGIAPAVLSSLAVASELSEGTLISPHVTGLDLHRPLRAVWPTGQHLTGPARDLYSISQRPV